MIFIHLLIGVSLGKIFGNYMFFILGSIIPDLDHVYIIVKNRLFNIKKIINTIKYEDKFKIRYKTPLFHSVLGLILFSLIFYIFTDKFFYFSLAYLFHLLIDWADVDEKYFLYPLKIKFRGFLPVWSDFEKILTIILLIVILVVHLI